LSCSYSKNHVSMILMKPHIFLIHKVERFRYRDTTLIIQLRVRILLLTGMTKRINAVMVSL